MPESIKDRPAKSHEYMFLLTKSAHYFYDAEAVKEPVTGQSHSRGVGVNPKCAGWATGDDHSAVGWNVEGNRIKGKTPGRNSRIHVSHDPAHERKVKHPRQNESFSAAVVGLVSKRNRRSVWTIGTHPFKGAHFATFPPKLVIPCITAGTSEHGCCPVCGAPYQRIVSKGKPDMQHRLACGSDENGEYHGQNQKEYQAHKAQPASTVKARILAGMVERTTVGWKQTCRCVTDLHPVPCRVLDPFGGSGTVAEVAIPRGLYVTLIELHPDYIAIAMDRLAPILQQPTLSL